MAVGPWRLLAAALAAAASADCEADSCAGQSSAPSLLMTKRALSKVDTALSCSALTLTGNFDIEADCSDVAVGSSCLVKCPAGYTGDAVRYFCFASLAEAGRPPAALHPPVCFSESQFAQGKVMPLAWGERGCVQCEARTRRICSTIPDASPSDERCTKFLVDTENTRISVSGTEVYIYIARGVRLGTWSYINNADFGFKVEAMKGWKGAEELCVNSGRGRICLQEMGLPKTFFDVKADKALLEPAMAALAQQDHEGFLKQLYALQTCRARLDTALPDEFWEWLAGDADLGKALLSTFPTYPGQVKMFSAIRDLVGHEKFNELGMGSFAVSLSYLNRFRSGLAAPVDFPRPKYERNGMTYLRGDEERMKQGMIAGHHCRLQSNECRDIHKCCGAPETWKFKWPRDPTPSVEEWVHFWLNKTSQHGDALWANPVSETPWMFGVYLWPSPLEECEWVHRKLIDGEAMEGRWYYYKSDFHVNVCNGGKYHPDSLPGIAVYGGVCGRMSTLNWRKSSCMGRPATQKGEPGHSAGFMLAKQTAIWTPLNTITDVSELVTLEITPPPEKWVTLELAKGDDAFPDEAATCLACRSKKTCTLEAVGSSKCTYFKVDSTASPPRIRTSYGQCITMRPGPRADSHKCWNVPDQNQDVTVGADGIATITGGRGTMRFRGTEVPGTELVWGKKLGCVKCSGSRGCEILSDADSSQCTLFRFDETSGLMFIQGMPKCLDMLKGGQPGIYKCNSKSSYQKFKTMADGSLHQSSKRGTIYFKRTAAKPIQSEFGRCLKCPSNAYATCSYVSANSSDCTSFFYDPKTQVLQMDKSSRARCLWIYQGAVAGTQSCSPNEHNRVVSTEGNKFTLSSSRGTISAYVPNGGVMPAIESRFKYSGFHEIKCPKSKCHWMSVLGLGSKESERWTGRHKEAALSMVEAWNDYETTGLYPTAHDEARLAASLVYALRRDSVASDEELEPVLAWALNRNPALYDAWELAAQFPGGGLSTKDIPNRDDLPSRQWFNKLELLGVDAKEGAAADGFARKHLVEGRHLAKFPHLRKTLVGRLCGALSQAMLLQLGEASSQCLQLQQLSRGQGFDDAKTTLLAEDMLSDGNMPTSAFEETWEVLANLVLSNTQPESLSDLVEDVLKSITIAYVNERSQTFYGEHGRLVLRAPAAYMLQLAGRVLPKERRQELAGHVQKLLESPNDSRVFASPPELKDAFLEWSSQAHPHASGAQERASVADDINGFGADDDANPEVSREMRLDRDEQMEQGSPLLRPAEDDEDGSQRDFDVTLLLEGLLDLKEEEEAAGDAALQQLSAQATAAQATAQAASEGPTQTELLQMCVKHTLG